jgi:hypothetical protein
MRDTQGRRFSDGTDPIKTAPQLYDTYDFVASFAVADATTNYNLKTQQATSFLNVPNAWLAVIWTDQDITVRLNSVDNPAIAIGMADSPFEFRDIFKITNIFITNASGSTANIKVMLV